MAATANTQPSAPWLRWEGAALIIDLHAQPGARQSEFAGVHGDALKVRIQAPPVDGKANKALLRFLADAFGVTLKQVTLVQGESNRRKRVRIESVSHFPDALSLYLP